MSLTAAYPPQICHDMRSQTPALSWGGLSMQTSCFAREASVLGQKIADTATESLHSRYPAGYLAAVDWMFTAVAATNKQEFLKWATPSAQAGLSEAGVLDCKPRAPESSTMTSGTSVCWFREAIPRLRRTGQGWSIIAQSSMLATAIVLFLFLPGVDWVRRGYS